MVACQIKGRLPRLEKPLGPGSQSYGCWICKELEREDCNELLITCEGCALMKQHVEHGGITQTIYSQIIHSDAMRSIALLDKIEFLKPAHVEIGAAVMVSCKVRSSIRTTTAVEQHRPRLHHPVLVPSACPTAGPDVRSSLRLLRSLGQRSGPGINQILKIPWGKEFISGDLHEVHAQVADMFAEDQQRDSGVRHPNRHLDGALFHVLKTCI